MDWISCCHLLAGLQSIPSDLYEAADWTEHRAGKCCGRRTIPLLKPFTAINVVLASLGAFSVFDLIYVMDPRRAV